MTPDQQNLLCYASLQLVKIIARDLGTRILEGTIGGSAFVDRDMKQLLRLCGYIHRVDPKMAELAFKVMAENSPKAQEQELLRTARASLGEDFFKKQDDEN